LSDFVAGVYTPNVANEARFGSTMTGTPTWAGLIDTVCRSGVPLSSGTLQRIEARIRVIGGGSGHQVRMALYASAAGGAPSALLAQSGTPVNVAAADQVYPSPLTAHLTAGTRYWLCLRANNGDVESAFVSLPGEGAIDFTQATGTFAAGFNPAFTASLYPSNGDEHIAGVYTPDNVPGAGRALIIGGGVF
jgi:hypothetical protein